MTICYNYPLTALQIGDTGVKALTDCKHLSLLSLMNCEVRIVSLGISQIWAMAIRKMAERKCYIEIQTDLAIFQMAGKLGETAKLHKYT